MVEVAIIGSGFSGIAMGIELVKKGVDNFIILEKNEDIGGTWRDNTYPGAECDVPSALYSYSFEPYPDWDYKWSHQPQILSYLKGCAEKYDLESRIRYGRHITSLKYSRDKSCWELSDGSGDPVKAQFVVTAVGQLHWPHIPEIKGASLFSGPSWHSSKWQHDVELTGKRVGVIGNAASAVQFIPHLANKVSSLLVFQRSANWMLPKPDRPYRSWEKSIRRRLPFLLRLERLKLWLKGGVLFWFMGDNDLIRKLGEWRSRKYLKSVIRDKTLRSKLIPDHPMGAKRILFSDDYYQALTRPHVHLVTDEIKAIYNGGVQTSQDLIPLDILIFATGFKTHPFLHSLDISGRDGSKLKDVWIKGEVTYLGMAIHGFPNFFMMYGPNTNLGHNSIIIMIESQAKYICECIRTVNQRGKSTVEVTVPAQTSFEQEMQRRLRKMVWSRIDKSWYKTNDRISNNWPGRTWEYMRRTAKIDWDHYIMA